MDFEAVTQSGFIVSRTVEPGRREDRTAAPLPEQGFLRRHLGQWNLSALKVPLTLSLLNQIISSGGNFILGVYLARTLALESFGWYGIAYGLCMLYVGVGNAVVLTQMLVNMPDKITALKEAYAAKMLCAVLMLGLALCLLTALGLGSAVLLNPANTRYVTQASAIALASALFLCNEFFIAYAYQKRREFLALTINLLTISVLFSGLALEHFSGYPLTPENVLLLYAAGATLGACVAYAATPLSLREGMRNFLPDFIESWRHGRWALGGVLVTWVQSQTYTYVLVLFLGPAGVGLANAAKIFISPFSFLLPAINKVAIPRLADLRNGNRQAMLKASVLLTAGLTMLTVIYSGLLLSSFSFVSHMVLGRHDDLIESLVWVWCLVLIFQIVRSGGGVLLQVQRKFRLLMLINIPSAVITVMAAMCLIIMFGSAGAIWGTLAGEITLAVLIWKEIWHDKAHGN